MLKKVKMGKNAKECFAEMSENRKMQNGLRSQMMQLDSPKLQKSIEKFRYGKRKTTFHEVTVGVYCQACSGIPLVVGFVGRGRLL